MIDWFDIAVPFAHRIINAGHVFSVGKDGEVDWQVNKADTVRGSYDSSMRVRSNDLNGETGMAKTLFISGNPAKFLQGHNVVGSDDICLLAFLTVNAIAKQFNLVTSHSTLQDGVALYTPIYSWRNGVAIVLNDFQTWPLLSGQFEVHKLDINYMFEVPHEADVDAFLDALATKTRTRTARAINDRGTVYTNKHSRYWCIKAYNKYREILRGGKDHNLPTELLNTPLVSFAFRKVRFELVLHSKELKRIKKRFEKEVNPLRYLQRKDLDNTPLEAVLLPPERIKSLFDYYLGSLNMNAQIPLSDQKLMDLPAKLRGIYTIWKSGAALEHFFSRASIYRYAKQFEPYGIDLRLPPETDDTRNNVVPLVRIIEAQPAAIPAALNQYVIH